MFAFHLMLRPARPSRRGESRSQDQSDDGLPDGAVPPGSLRAGVSRSEDLAVDDREEETRDGVDDIEKRDEGEVGLEVEEESDGDGSKETEGPGERHGEVTSLPGHVAVVLQSVDHTDVLINT